MGSAAVISLEEFRQGRARADAQQQLHERFDCEICKSTGTKTTGDRNKYSHLWHTI